MERYAYILDYLPTGRATETGYHKEPIALAIGEAELKLFELVPKLGQRLTVAGRIPLVPGLESPPPIDHVRRRIGYDELTSAAKTELPGALERIVASDPPR